MHSIFSVRILAYLVIASLCPCHGNDFDREKFLVSFDPYVKLPDDFGEIPDLYSYTLQNVKTALEVVSRKFSKVVTNEVGASSEEYIEGFTYNHQSFGNVFTAEAAALINRERGSRSIRVVVGLHHHKTMALMQVEIAVALEAVRKANGIYPETAVGILIYGEPDNETVAEQTVGILKQLHGTATQLGIQLGARIYCSGISSNDNTTAVIRINHDIVMQADFVICDAAPAGDVQRADPRLKFLPLGYRLLGWRRAIRRLKPNIDVWLRTLWPSPRVETTQTIENQRIYWEAANTWALRENITIMMIEAFNTPFRSPGSLGGPLAGWWKLTDNSLINSVDGYVEKTTGIRGIMTTTTTEVPSTTTTITTTEIATTTASPTTTVATTETEAETSTVIATTEVTGEVTASLPVVTITDAVTTFKTTSTSTMAARATVEIETTTDAPTTETIPSRKVNLESVTPGVDKEEQTQTSNPVSTPSLNVELSTSAPIYIREGRNESSSSDLGVPTLISIIIGTIAVLLAAAALVVIALRFRRPQETNTKDNKFLDFFYGTSANTDNMYSTYTPLDSALTCPYDVSYEIPKDKLVIENNKLLGKGQFGCVFRASIKQDEGSVAVALKMTKSDVPTNAINSILSEIKILTYLGKQENIVGMIGAYTAELTSGTVYLATELCGNGSLEDYLRKKLCPTGTLDRYASVLGRNKNVDADVVFHELVRWSHEIACGMEFLGTKHVVHADLATRNVLLTSERTAKITDFGLSRRMYDYQNYVKTKQEPLPWRWMAIESLKRCEFSEQSDVWSYGVTLWEIFTKGDTPYPGLAWTLNFVHRLVDGLRLERPPLATDEMYSLMSRCWDVDPRSRLTFNDLKLMTGEIMESIVEARNSGEL